MEIKILELKKIPGQVKNEEDIINWMRFLGGKTRKEFADMAKTDEYIEEAYRELEKMSSDERTKLEYEARQRAIRDYNSQMSSALKRGMKKGIEKGLEQGIQQGAESKLREIVERMLRQGKTAEEIAGILGESPETITRIAETLSISDRRDYES